MTDEGYTEVLIECSPFIRTMMTAANIAKGLGIRKIKINYLYSELLGDNLFETCPMKHTLIRNKDPRDLVEHYLDGVEFEDSESFKI